jgi:hypothetical protein
MPGAWIEAARQHVRVVCNHSKVLWKLDHYTFRFNEHGSAADNAAVAERCRLDSVCRGRKLDAKCDTKLFEACVLSSGSISEVFEDKSRRTKKAAAAVSLLHL